MKSIKLALFLSFISLASFASETQLTTDQSFSGVLKFANPSANESCQVDWESSSPTTINAQLKSLQNSDLSRSIDIKIEGLSYAFETPDFSETFHLRLNPSYIAKYTKKVIQSIEVQNQDGSTDQLSAAYDIILNTERKEFEVRLQVLLQKVSGQVFISKYSKVLVCR